MHSQSSRRLEAEPGFSLGPQTEGFAPLVQTGLGGTDKLPSKPGDEKETQERRQKLERPFPTLNS